MDFVKIFNNKAHEEANNIENHFDFEMYYYVRIQEVEKQFHQFLQYMKILKIIKK